MSDVISKNMIVIDCVKLGEVIFYITRYCGYDAKPGVAMPYYKPNGDYGSIKIKDFDNVFAGKFTITTCKTPNKYLNGLLKNNERWFKLGEPMCGDETTLIHNNKVFFIGLNESDFTITPYSNGINPVCLSYKTSKKRIANVLDVMAAGINIIESVDVV